MGKDTTTAADHPTTNAQAHVVDPDAPKPPAYLVLGTTPHAFDNPPEPGDVLTIVARVRCKGFAGDLAADGKFVHKRKMTMVAAWLQGDPEPPEADDEDPPTLFDESGDPEDGDPADDATGDPDDPDAPDVPDPADASDGVDGVEPIGKVIAAEFSHAKTEGKGDDWDYPEAEGTK